MAKRSRTYTTIQGDTWDKIAFKVYGVESYAHYLMQSNYEHLETLIFSAGTVLQVPAVPEEQSGDLPPWGTVNQSDEDDGVDPYDI